MEEPRGAFHEGETVAGRFRVGRLIVSGAHGDVYESEDLELSERVALRLLPPRFPADPSATARLKRDLFLARSVTHPNVCRLYELFRHQNAPRAGEEPARGPHERLVLSMELLEGETLADFLSRRGPLPSQQAVDVLRQVVEGLAAAHRAGLVHGELASRNVLLVTGPSTPKSSSVRAGTSSGRHRALSSGALKLPGLLARRVVVTGLGLRSAAPGPLPAGPYLAPELSTTGGAEGEGEGEASAATVAADVFSLGVLLSEMLTGSPSGQGAVSDPRLRPVIARCVPTNPGDRFRSALDVLRAAEGPEGLASGGTAALKRRAKTRQKSLYAAAAALVLLSAAAALLVSRNGSESQALVPPASSGAATSPRPLRTLQLTSSAGLDLFPVLSPDGRRLAFSSDRSGTFEIWTKDLASPSSEERPLTSDGQQNFCPVFSPDGRDIAFHSKTNGGIWVVPAAGGTPRQVAPFGSRPAFSPDGSLVAFQSEPIVDISATALVALAPSTLWVVPADGSGPPRAVTQVGQPAGGHGAPTFTPDGRRLVFVASETQTSELWSTEVDRPSLVRLAWEQPSHLDPVVTPDGRAVLYIAISRTFAQALWRLPLDARTGAPAGTPRQVGTLGLGTIKHLSRDASGRRLAYASMTVSGNLWSVEASNPARVAESRPLTSESVRSSRPLFSPDGRKVAFVKWLPGVNPGDIWLMGADGRDPSQLTTELSIDSMPSFTPDGDVVFLTNRRGKPEIWIHRMRTGRQEPLVDSIVPPDNPRVSPDGRWLAFSARGGDGVINTWRQPLDGGSPRQLTFDREMAGWPAISPDGKWVAVELRRGDDVHVGLVPSAGGELRVLTRKTGQAWPHSFTPDGERIAFAGLRQGVWNVYTISRRTAEERVLTAHRRPNAFVRYPTVSPNGSQIVYEYSETTGNIWLVDELE